MNKTTDVSEKEKKPEIKKNNKRQKIFNAGITIIVIILFLLSTVSLYVNLAKEPKKGEKGDTGAQGIQGYDGKDGKDAVFEYQWNGTSLQIKNKDGIWGSLVDLKGLKGDKGKDGDGSNGINGKDCQPNKKPIITLININGSRISKCTEFTFWLNISVDDPENDNLQVDFYYSEEANSSFIYYETFFGTDGTYGTTIIFEYPYFVEHKILYLKAVVWDGSDISLGNYEFTI